MFKKFAPLKPLFSIYGSVFILSSPVLGIILALITFLHPNVAIMGVLGLSFTALLFWLMDMPLHTVSVKATLRNGLLLGLLIGDLFVLEPAILPFLALAMLFNLAVTAALESIFNQRHVPVMSLPFCISALIIFMIQRNLYEVAHFGNATLIFSEYSVVHFLPQSLLALFRAMGSILCIRDAAIGLLILGAITVISPLTALFLTVGFFIGTATESLFHVVTSSPLLYSEGYNYALVFTAIAGFLMVPSCTSMLLATAAVMITSAIIIACNYVFYPFYLPILSLPFNMVMVITLLALKSLRPLWLSHIAFVTPEHSIEYTHLLWNRHRLGEVGIFLPMEGSWKIQQGFDGTITHRGLWRHALDFVAVDENDRAWKDTGLALSDHLSFGKAVLSPLEGYVVACEGAVPDNPIGQVANDRNWGNYVIVRSYDGICVTLSHLKQGSLTVKTGDKLYVGQKLGECGNSGYSQEPHLHVQVHHLPEIGAVTIPFHLLNYAIGNHLYFHRTPLIHETLKSLKLNPDINALLNFKIGEVMVFACKSLDHHITLTHQLDEITGRCYITDGVSRLSIAKIGTQCYFYDLTGRKHSPVWDLFASAPRIPMIEGEIVTYSDCLPLCFTQKIIGRFCSYLRHFAKLPIEKSGGTYSLNAQKLEIHGAVYFQGKKVESFFKLDPVLGISAFSIDDRHYVRGQ